MKKQTAVEWLVKELNKMIDFIPMDKWDKIRDIVQQAKEMEKEQIINAHGDEQSYLQDDVIWIRISGTEYYNETFKKETK
jgi:hypothetical protein